MRNFVFISPNFPTNYWKFCRELKNNGLNVLGIGDQPYNELLPELKDSLNEYYKVNSMENYDEVLKAVAFFIHKYGPIEFLESNNEYWLERDAWLRDQFNIPHGFRTSDIPKIKFKSGMKEYYIKANVPVARYHIVDDRDSCLSFIDEVGYPVIVKPDNGVGASSTYKLKSTEELDFFLSTKDSKVSYIMEEFINAEINSYDAIVDENGDPLFEAGNVTPHSLMDVVNNAEDSVYFIVKDLSDDVREMGRKVVKSFGARSRFVHFEFFRLLSDQHIGKKGDVVALEVNMRPAGGFTPDMFNFARSTNVYKIWADMVAYGSSSLPEGQHYYCAFVGRRDGVEYNVGREDLLKRYAGCFKMVERIPDALSGAMGNQMFVANFDTEEAMNQFYADALSRK